MRDAGLLCALILLSACGPEPTSPPRPEPRAAASPRPGAALPPIGPEPRYVGRWAASEQLCKEGPWTFRAASLTTAGEVACDFTRVSPTPSGYEIAATCRAEAPPKPYSLTLTFAESAKAMIVEDGPFAGPIGLIWCGAR